MQGLSIISLNAELSGFDDQEIEHGEVKNKSGKYYALGCELLVCGWSSSGVGSSSRIQCYIVVRWTFSEPTMILSAEFSSLDFSMVHSYRLLRLGMRCRFDGG